MRGSGTHPPPADLQHDEHKVVVLEEAVKADDVVVVQGLVDGDLGRHLLALVLLQDQRLGHDLAGEHLLGLQVCDLVALGEAALPEEPAPGVSPGAPGVDQDVGDLLQRSRLGVDMCRRVRRLGYGRAHFGSI